MNEHHERGNADLVEAPTELTVKFPARRGYLGISRLVATALAADNGFDVDDLDDLRLAINEAVAWLVDHGDGDPAEIELAITCRAGEIEFVGLHDRQRLDTPELSDLAHAVLAVTVDESGTGLDDAGRPYVRLSKRASSDE